MEIQSHITSSPPRSSSLNTRGSNKNKILSGAIRSLGSQVGPRRGDLALNRTTHTIQIPNVPGSDFGYEVIWGTTVNVADVVQIVRQFLTQFQKYGVRYYMELLEESILNQLTFLR